MAKRVLIADDMKLMRALLANALTGSGCEVVAEAENGQEAVEKFMEARPDIVFLDIEMPVMSGIDALKKIIAADPDAIVIMATSVDNYDVVDDCMESGATDFVRKDKLNEIPQRLAAYLG